MTLSRREQVRERQRATGRVPIQLAPGCWIGRHKPEWQNVRVRMLWKGEMQNVQVQWGNCRDCGRTVDSVRYRVEKV